MVKRIAALILICIFSLSGCGVKEAAVSPTPAQSTATPVITAAAAPEPTRTPAAYTGYSPSEPWVLVDQIGGVTKALCLEGDILYVGTGLHVMILDASDPQSMTVLGTSRLLPNFVESITSDGRGKLYACCGSGGLAILDVSNPAAPRLLSVLDTRGYIEGATLYQNYAVLADGPQGIQVVDVSDPTKPGIVSEAYPLAYVYDVAIENGVAYAAGGTSGLFTIDLSDPKQPVEAGLIQLDGCQYDAELMDGKLYLAGAWGGISVFDLTQPLNPARIATVQTEGWAMALSSAEHNLLVLDGANGVDLFGIAGRQPAKMSTFAYSGYVIDGATNGKTAFVLDEEKGLIVIDYSVKAAPKPVCRWIPLLDGRRVDANGGICCVAGGLSGFHVYDTNELGTPVETYWFDTGEGYANEVEVRNDTAFVAMRLAAQPPLMAFDASDPHSVKPLGILDNSGWKYQIKGGPLMFDGEYAFMTGYDPISMDISDPTNIRVLGFVDGIETGSGDVRGDLFVARSTSDMYFIDKSDPQNMQLLSTLDVDSAGAAIRFISDTLILAATNYGVEVYDVSDPYHPRSVSKLDLGGDISDIFLDGTVAYLAAQGKGIYIVDISDPLNMIYLDTVKTLNCAWDCYVQGGVMYVADGTSGLTIYQRGGALENTNAQSTEFTAFDLFLGPIDPASIEYTQAPTPLERPNTAHEFIVTSTADSGQGTLRDALETNRLQDNTTITFDPAVFPADNPATIRLESNLCPVDRNFITIDASNAGVILDGGSEVPRGLDLYGAYITVMGMQLTGFTEGGILSNGAYAQIGGNRNIGEGPVGQGNQVGNSYLAIKINGYGSLAQGNLVGVDVTGLNAAPNWSGIFVVDGDNTVVGGIHDGEGNVVSASERGNITSWCDNVRVIGNIVGLDITGTKALGQQTEFGVFCELTAVNNIVGGTTPEERNVISGVQTGLIFGDQRTYQCTAVGNYIGTDITGTKAIPNRSGYASYVSYHNRIGGTAQGEGNVISGNSGTGVDALNDTFVLGNYIGVASDGKTPLPNDYAVTLHSYANIGGYTPEEGNLICGKTFSVMTDTPGVTGCYIAGNTFASKSSSGIWLQKGATGVFIQNNTFCPTSNFAVLIDGGGGNSIRGNRFVGNKTKDFISLYQGGNDNLPAPTVTYAVGSSASGTTVAFGRVEVYLYAKDQIVSLGFCDADANGSFTFVSAEPLSGKQVILLVTDTMGNTSAFSQPTKIP